MKNNWCYFLFLLLFINCVGEDLIDDYVDPNLRITNPIISIQERLSHQFKVLFFDESGTKVSNPKLTWSIMPKTLASIDANGTLTALKPGKVTVKVTGVGLKGKVVEQTTNFDILPAPSTEIIAPTNPEETITMVSTETIIVTGTDSMTVIDTSSSTTENGVVLASMYYEGKIISTSNYHLEGNFRYEHNGEQIILSIDNSYNASTALPGLYIYLGNNPSTVSDAYEIGAVEVFSGAHDYVLPESIQLMDYKYILYWCKPFNVKVGEAEIF